MIWRDIPSHPFFQASTDGSVRRQEMLALNGRTFRAKMLKASLDHAGYPCVSVISPQPPRYRKIRVSRLVCEAFKGRPPAGKDWALHSDGDPTNNRPQNLRWGDAQDNADDTISHGRRPWGEQHHMAKLSVRDVLTIRASIGSLDEIAARFSITKSTACAIRLYQTWKHLEAQS